MTLRPLVNSKKKGDVFERKIAKILGDWWGVPFSRTPQSGGASWGAQNNAVGDILPPITAGFPLVIECKHRENWTIENVLLNNKEPHTWWEQVIRDSMKVDKVPCLIFTRNRANTFVALPYRLEVYKDIRDNDYPAMRTDFIIENIHGDNSYYDVLVTTIEALTNFTPDYIREQYGEHKTSPYRIRESEVTKDLKTKDTDEVITDILDQI